MSMRVTGSLRAASSKVFPPRYLSHFQAEIAQAGAHAVLDRRHLVDEELPGVENGAHLLTIERLDVHGLEPSKPKQLSNTARVVAICLDHHRCKSCPDMTAFHGGDAEAFLRQFGVQPFGELTTRIMTGFSDPAKLYDITYQLLSGMIRLHKLP